jgi:hypothetical protein
MTHSDWYAIAGLMMEMAEDTDHEYSIHLTSAGSVKHPDLLVECIAVPRGAHDADLVNSESVKFLASSLRSPALRAVFTYALYQMNFQLSKPEEFGAPF